MPLNSRIEEFLLERGALKVAFAGLQSLEGGPPSADLTYILPEARSAVSFALPLDRDKIRAFLGKRSQAQHEADNIQMNLRISQVGKELAGWLEQKGFAAQRVHANLVYRQDEPDWRMQLHPDLSHRYIAVASGLGSFGWSGNVGIKGHGTAIILGTVVTSAELEPGTPIPEEESFCTRCKLCAASCAGGMFSKKEETSVTLGGTAFTFAARHAYAICDFVCGGFTGLHKSGKWSTWSPGRYRIPEEKNDIYMELFRAVANYGSWPERGDGASGYYNPAIPDKKVYLTCGTCQVLCWGDEEETRENYRLLTSSGCVLQRENGSLEVLPAKEAADAFGKLDPAHRALYE